MLTGHGAFRRRTQLRFFSADLVPSSAIFYITRLVCQLLWALHENHAISFNCRVISLRHKRSVAGATVGRNCFPSSLGKPNLICRIFLTHQSFALPFVCPTIWNDGRIKVKAVHFIQINTSTMLPNLFSTLFSPLLWAFLTHSRTSSPAWLFSCRKFQIVFTINHNNLQSY